MSLTEKINSFIRDEYGKLQTQQAVAERLGVTQTYIHQLLSGKSKASNITAGVIDKMFPNAVIDLTGNSGNAVINSGANASGCINHHCNISTASPSVPVPSARDFLDALMFSSEIDEALKASIYRVYSEFTRGNDKG